MGVPLLTACAIGSIIFDKQSEPKSHGCSKIKPQFRTFKRNVLTMYIFLALCKNVSYFDFSSGIQLNSWLKVWFVLFALVTWKMQILPLDSGAVLCFLQEKGATRAF